MEILETNKENQLPLLLVSVIISFALTYYAIPWITDPFYIFWLLPIILIFFIVTPLGNIQLQSKKSYKIPLARKITYNVLLQCALLFSYAGFCHIIGNIIPSQFHVQNALFSQTIPTVMLHFGLAPWCILTIFTLSLTYSCYVKNKNTYYSQLCFPIIKNCNPGSKGANIINLSIQLSNHMAVACLIITLAVLIAHWLLTGTSSMIHGFNLATVLFAAILIILCNNARLNKLIIQASFYILPSLTCFIIAMAIAILFTIFCVFLYPLAVTAIPISHFLITTTPQQWHALWLLTSLSWWFLMMVLLAPIFTRYNNGYTVRNTILTMMGLPLCGLILAALHYADIINLYPLGEFIQHSVLGNTLSTVSMASLIIIVFNTQNTPSLVLTSLSPPKKIKYRSPSFTLRRICAACSFTFGLYLCLGIHFLSWYWICITYIIGFVVLCISLGLIRTLWLHHQTTKK